MPVYSKRSQTNLSSCHIDIQTLFNEVIKEVDCTIVCGHRNEKDQNEAYERGNSKKRWPDGKHNSMPSLAVDVYICPIDFYNEEAFFWFAGYVQATADRLKAEGKMQYGITWGGAWKGHHIFNAKDKKILQDYCHFELKIKN